MLLGKLNKKEGEMWMLRGETSGREAAVAHSSVLHCALRRQFWGIS